MNLLTTDFSSTLTSKGQVTIPLPLRRKLNLKPKSRVVFSYNHKSIRLKPQKTLSVSELFGSVPPLKHPLTDKQMHDIAWEDKLREFR